MNLHTIETPSRYEARRRFLEYRRAVRERHSSEDEAIMLGYCALAQGKQLISLRQTILDGGFESRAYRWGANDSTAILPKLAVCRAHMATVETRGLGWNDEYGQSGFHGVGFHSPGWNLRKNSAYGRLNVDGLGTVSGDTREEWVARVPLVPPALRPKHHLSNYHILFEAVWAQKNPQAPHDPALLKQIKGDLFAVIATWNLTPLERAVLAVRPLR